jgi:co-chaperonin GroES (HSP10)
MADFFVDEIIPLRNQLLVQLVTKPRMRGKLFLPHSDNEEDHIGKILALGNKIEDKSLQVNQYVMFEGFAGRKIKIDGKASKLIEETHLIAVINTAETKFEE